MPILDFTGQQSPEAAPAWQTPAGLVALSYACISGPRGAPRPWGLFEQLFAPGAQLVRLLDGDAGQPRTERFSPAGYAASRARLFERTGLHESETHHEVSISGRLAQVRSSYEARLSPGGPTVFAGVNCLQLVWASDRWWIQSICWDGSAAEQTMAELAQAPGDDGQSGWSATTGPVGTSP